MQLSNKESTLKEDLAPEDKTKMETEDETEDETEEGTEGGTAPYSKR